MRSLKDNWRRFIRPDALPVAQPIVKAILTHSKALPGIS